MQIPFGQLAAQLDKQLQALYVLHGDEILLQNEAVDQIQQAAIARGFHSQSTHVLQGTHADWAGVLTALSSPGLFADKQRIRLHIPTGKPGKEGAKVLESLAAHIASKAEDTLLIVQLPRADKTMQATNWFKALAQVSVGVLVSIDTIDRAALPRWIAQRLSQQGLQLTPGLEGEQTLAFLVDRVEGNLLAAHQEIQKLALLYRPSESAISTPTVLSLAQVQAAVAEVARYDVFALSQTVWQGEGARVDHMIQGLCEEGVACVLVHWVLAQDIRHLFQLKHKVQQGKPLAHALRAARIWGEKERLFTQLIPRLSENHLRQLLWNAHVVDGIVKGLPNANWPQDPWLAVRRLAWQLNRLVQKRQVKAQTQTQTQTQVAGQRGR
jgi:DNA polymerase-3 subunit delta